MPRKMKPRRQMRPPNMPQQMMKGMMDMGTMAVGGAVLIGTIGMAGSLLKK